MKTFLRYSGAFCAGFVGAFIPCLMGGRVPQLTDLGPAVAQGLIATGLFHMVPPRANPQS